MNEQSVSSIVFIYELDNGYNVQWVYIHTNGSLGFPTMSVLFSGCLSNTAKLIIMAVNEIYLTAWSPLGHDRE